MRLALLLIACLLGSSAVAQGTDAPALPTPAEIDADLEVLMVPMVDALGGLPPDKEAALARVMANPDLTLDVIERRFAFPPPDRLETYPELTRHQHVGVLLAIVGEIPGYHATDLLRRIYLRTAADNDTLDARFDRLLDRIGRPPRQSMAEYYVARHASAAAGSIHNDVLRQLAQRGIPDVLAHGRERYAQAGDGGRAAIDRYTRRMAGRLPPLERDSFRPVPDAEVRPVLLCVRERAPGELTAFFGYENASGSPVRIPRGDRNHLLPAPYDGLQPETFELREAPVLDRRRPTYPAYALAVTFPPGDAVTWRLGRGTAEASDASPRCSVP